MVFCIADLYFEIIGGENTIKTLHKLSGFAPFLVKEVPSDSEILSFKALYDIAPIKDAVLLHQFDFEEIDCYFYKDGEMLQFDMIPRDGSSTFSCRHRIGDNIVYATECTSAMLLRFALWMGYGFFATIRNRIAIHSSAIVYTADNKEAVLFLGESGTGKSTHTRLWRENINACYLLNDDSPILRCDNGGKVIVYGSPWSGKTPCYKQDHSLVAAFVRLSQAPYNKIKNLNRLASLAALLPSCPPAFAYESNLQTSILNTLSNIIRQTKVCHLECLPDKEAVDTVISNLWPNN